MSKNKRKKNLAKVRCGNVDTSALEKILADNANGYVSKSVLCQMLDLTDRKVRRLKQILSYKRVVLADSKGKGYKVISSIENMSAEERSCLKRELQADVRSMQHRIDSLHMTMRTDIAMIKVLEKFDTIKGI